MNRARRVLAAAALAALGASGAAADDGFAMVDDCWGGIVESLTAIGTEFPEFRPGDVRLHLGFLKAAREANRETVVSPDPSDEDLQEFLRGAFAVCAASDGVAEILRALRDGARGIAGQMWAQWRWDGSLP